jgi:beta-glucosidase
MRPLIAATASAVVIGAMFAAPESATAAAVNLAPLGTASASSSDSATTGPARAIDGDPATRWSSLAADPQRLDVDLGARAQVDQVRLRWGTAYASAFTVLTSADGRTWRTVYQKTAGTGGVDEITLAGATVRYLQVLGTARGTTGGYALSEVEVLGAYVEQAATMVADAVSLPERGTVAVPVRLNKAATTPVMVNYATVDGTAKAGSDYTATSGTLTFAAGETEKSITVAAVDDAATEPAESFTVMIADQSGAVLVSPRATTTVTVVDDDVPGAPRTLRDFEGTVPIGRGPAGIWPYGGDADDRPVLTAPVVARPGTPAGNHALHVTYHAQAFGGFADNFLYDRDPQDWSGFLGFRFWFKGGNTAPLPAGTGPLINMEIRDGGVNGEKSELWTTSFTDDFADWRLIEIPFSQFVYRTDFQPIGGINHTLDLTAMWGYSFNMPINRPGLFDLDDVQVYGLRPPLATIGTAKPVYTVDEGDTATVNVTMTTPDGRPLARDVEVRYQTGGGTATGGVDYTAGSGAVTFPAGSASGAVRPITIRTAAGGGAEVAETFDVSLTAPSGVLLAADLPVTVVINAQGFPYLDPSLSVTTRVNDLLSRMSLADKVGQMTQAERAAVNGNPDDIATYRLGSLLSGGGSTPTPNTPVGWADMVDGFQLRAQQAPLQIPLIYGVDAVHGHNNLVGATIFPHNIGLGATRNPALVERVGAITAQEVGATGPRWDFSPCLCVAREDRWGRTYESFGEDPGLVSAMAGIVRGYEQNGVLATLKHWVGDGATAYGSSTSGRYTVDQGVTRLSDSELWFQQIAPYQAGIANGAGAVMPSYSSFDNGTGPLKMHANKALVTDMLKGRLGFDGFTISDWSGIDQIPGDYRSDITTSINAGLDMIMVPFQYVNFTTLLTQQVVAGAVPQTRVDDAVRRILRQKFELGLFENRYTDRSRIAEIGSAAHRAVARQAVAESQTLLKNDGNLLPLPKNAKLYVAGSNADDIGNQAGGWTVTWQGASGNITPGTTVLAGIREIAPQATITYSKDASADPTGNDFGVVVVGETPYAEGVGDVGNNRPDLSLSAADQAAIDKVCAAMKCVVLIVAGRPQLLDPAKFANVPGVVMSWLPGTEGAGVAQPLFGDTGYTGRLPDSWPRTMAQEPINVGDAVYDPLYPYGWGLRTDPLQTRLTAARKSVTALSAKAPAAKSAATSLDSALDSAMWNADGTVRDADAVIAALTGATARLESSGLKVDAQVDRIVSVVRDLVQDRMVAKAGTPAAVTAAGLTATAERELVAGRPAKSLRRFAAAWTALR